MQGLHLGNDKVGGGQRVCTRLLDNAQAHARLAGEGGVYAIVLGPKLDAGHVAQADSPALGVGADGDIAELFRRLQAALDVDRRLEGRGIGREGRLAQRAGCSLDVLGLQGSDDVLGRQVQRSGLGRVDPDAHGVVAATKDPNRSHAVKTQQAIADNRVAQVAQIGGVD